MKSCSFCKRSCPDHWLFKYPLNDEFVCGDCVEGRMEALITIDIDPKDPKYLGIPNISFSLTSSDDEREDHFRKQRLERGFDDSELWNLRGVLSGFVLPRLKVFADSPASYPSNLSNCDEWVSILESIISAFELIYEDNFTVDSQSIINTGLDLFREYFFDLWD